MYVDSEKVTAEVKNVFGHGEPQQDIGNPHHESLVERGEPQQDIGNPHHESLVERGEPQQDIGNPHHESLVERASRLCKELRSDPAKALSKHSKGGKKRKRESIKEYQKNLVVIDYPGRNPCDVTPLREYDKLLDGSIRISSNMDEEDIREEIARILREKSSCTHDLSGIKINDFIFVRCANKKVRVPDGDSPFDSKGICHTYTHGAIYVRLNKPMWKGKVCLCKL